MIENLLVKNVALIEDANIDFENGLNALTGETGAGKSILLDAIGLLLGNRADKTLIRSGETQCKVVGRFFINPDVKANFKAFCEKFDFEESDDVVVTRLFNLDGRGDIKINGQPATLAMLKELSAMLVDLYGQNESQVIFDTASHLKILDAFAKTAENVDYAKYQKLYSQLSDINSKLKQFGGSEEERQRSIDILTYQIQEIESAKISADDFAETESKRHILLNAGKIISNTILAQNSLNDGVATNISRAKSGLAQASTYDGTLQSLADRLDSVLIELDDILETIQDYNNGADFSESEQQQIEDRYSLYGKLLRKYGKTVDDVLQELNNMKQELDRLKNADREIAELLDKKAKVLNELLLTGKRISDYRKKMADKLARLIEGNLKNLSMKNAKIKFSFVLPALDETAIKQNGIDNVELLFSANLGETEKPLSKIASGGEISRFMLALKSVIASVDKMPTMIFDEIDTGISGATSEAVAKQMAIIAKKHQVIVVTHSQQIASMADYNFLIKKMENNGRTFTEVKRLSEEEKVIEVARFMSGATISKQAIESATSLIAEQNAYKVELEKINN